MPLDLEMNTVRRFDTSSFTGDTWAVQATQALPPDDGTVPRFVANGGPVRWTVAGMVSGDDGSAQVADAVTSISTLMIKISRTPRLEAITRTLAATTGVIVGTEITEDDVSPGDVFVIAISASTAGVGSADWLWAWPTAGCSLLADGASP